MCWIACQEDSSEIDPYDIKELQDPDKVILLPSIIGVNLILIMKDLLVVFAPLFPYQMRKTWMYSLYLQTVVFVMIKDLLET